MARFKAVPVSEAYPNGLKPFTPEEESQRDADEAAWEAAKPQLETLAKIAVLEIQVTQRRLREAALTDEGKAWLQNIEDQIAAERARLR